MARVLKWLCVVLVVVVLLIGGAAFLLPHLVDPNDYRETIADAVTERIGRPFEIQGNLKLTIFPWLGVEVGPVHIGQPSGFGVDGFPAHTPFLTAHAAQIRVKLLPLLTSRVEMDTLIADGLTVNLARRADGRTNWDDFMQSGEPTAGGTNVGPLALGGLSLRDAAVHMHDEQANRRLALRKVALDTGPVGLGAPIRIETEFDIEATDPALEGKTVAGHVKGSADIQLDPGAEQVLVRGLALNVGLRNEAGEQAELSVAGGLGYTLSTEALAAPKLTISASSAGFDGHTGDVTTTLVNAAANLATSTFQAERFESAGKLSAGILGSGEIDFSATGGAQLELGEGNLRVANLAVNVPALAYEGTQGTAAFKANIDAQFNAQRFNVEGLDLEAKLEGDALQGGHADIVVKGELAIDLSRLVASSKRFEIVANEFDAAGFKGAFRATGALEANSQTQQFHLSGFAADGRLTESRALPGTVPFLLRGDVLLDLGAGSARTNALRIESSDFDTGPAKGSFSVALEAARMDLAASTIDAKALGISAKLTGKSAFEGDAALSVKGSGLSASKAGVSLKGFHFDLPGLEIAGNRIALDVRGALNADFAASRIELRDLTTKGQLKGAALEGGGVQFDGTTNASYQFEKGNFALSELTLAMSDLRYADLTGAMQVKGHVVGNALEGVFTGKQMRVRGHLQGNPIPGQHVDFDVRSDANVNLAADTMRVSKLNANVAGVTAKGALNVTELSSAPAYQGTLALAPFKPRPLLERFGLRSIHTADPKALGRVSARAAISGTPDKVALRNLVLELDQSTAKGNVSVSGLDGGIQRPLVRFDLALNGIDADRYASAQSPTPEKKPADSPPPGALPLALLTTVDLDGTLRVGKLKTNNVRVSNFKLTAKGKDRKLALDPVTANLYRGSLTAKGSIDASKPVPVITVEKTFRGVQAGPLLADLEGRAPVTGTADFELALRSQGKSQREIIGNSNGTTRFAMRDGTIEGVNIVREICGQLTQFGVVSAADGRADQTPFSNLSGTGQIRNGVLYNDDMSITSPFLRVTGRGNVEFLRETLGYAVTAHLVDSCEGQGRGLVADLVEVPIPIRISGPIAKPRFGFDFDRLLESLTAKQIEKQGSRLIEKALGGRRSGGSSGLGEDAIKGLLKGLFK